LPRSFNPVGTDTVPRNASPPPWRSARQVSETLTLVFVRLTVPRSPCDVSPRGADVAGAIAAPIVTAPAVHAMTRTQWFFRILLVFGITLLTASAQTRRGAPVQQSGSWTWNSSPGR
jgi:hypothetical protein